MADTRDAAGTHDVRDPAAFGQLMQLEREATHIFLNQPLFLPGLLQVASYASAMIGKITGLDSSDPEELRERVRVRMQRAEGLQKRLQSDAPPHVWAAIDEGVVRRAAVMREQLAHLATVAEFDTVHLTVIPFSHGPYAGLGGSFEVHELANGDASVFFEGAHADELVESDPAVARRYRDSVKRMVQSGVDARALLRTISGDL
jgi:hypothetical protein